MSTYEWSIVVPRPALPQRGPPFFSDQANMPGDRSLPLLRPAMPELDCIRGVAVLMVVTYHGLFWSAGVEESRGIARFILLATQPGWLGVQLFFVLSGFLITGILVDARRRPDYFRRFYRRRALRILPAYAVTLAIVAVAYRPPAGSMVAATLFLANCADLLGMSNPFGPLWSLAVEEQFYLVWPSVVRFASRRVLAWTAALALLASPFIRLAAFQAGAVEGLYGHTWYNLEGLSLGALIALLLRRPATTRTTARWSAGALLSAGAALLIVGLPFGILHRTNALGAALQLTPWVLIFGGSLLGALLIGSGPYRALFDRPAFRFFGEISYGLYLYHLLVFSALDAVVGYLGNDASPHGRLAPMLARFVTGALLATAVATISRRTFEEWFLRMKGPPSTATTASRPGVAQHRGRHGSGKAAIR